MPRYRNSEPYEEWFQRPWLVNFEFKSHLLLKRPDAAANVKGVCKTCGVTCCGRVYTATNWEVHLKRHPDIYAECMRKKQLRRQRLSMVVENESLPDGGSLEMSPSEPSPATVVEEEDEDTTHWKAYCKDVCERMSSVKDRETRKTLSFWMETFYQACQTQEMNANSGDIPLDLTTKVRL